MRHCKLHYIVQAPRAICSHIQGMSMTPEVHLCLRLPPDLRDHLSAMFLGAVKPTSASHPLILVPVFEMIAVLGPCGQGGSIDSDTYWALVAFRVDDSCWSGKRSRAKQSPAYNGACIPCLESGIRVQTV